MYRIPRVELYAALLLTLLASTSAFAQSAASPSVTLPELSVAGSSAPSVGTSPAPGENAGSVTVPSVAQQRAAVNSTVGSVAFVDAEDFQDRYANTLRDVLKDVPGVYVQERYGQELRLSIRGSGIARGFHLRGIEVLQDGIPFNLADGSGDFYQIDPLALRSAEVYKGGNALTFGATTLGGAVNFVTPTAYTAFAPNILRIDGGSFGTIRENFQFSRISGPVDFMVNGTFTNSDGFRFHETQRTQNFNANIGYQLAPGVETRFYLGGYLTDQKLPGSITLGQALNTPRIANLSAITGNQSRRVETERVANRTSFLLDVGKLDIDTWAIHKNLYHPIFQVIDQDGWTYGISPHWAGTFDVGGFRNDTILGLRAFAGQNSAQQFVNIQGQRGVQTLNALQSASNYEAYGENRFWFLPDMALMTGAKLFSSNRTYSNKGGLPASPRVQYGNITYEGINPKIGLLWQPLPDIQVFADITRSRDVPDFSDLVQQNLISATFVPLAAQRAWTYEAGSRGHIDRLTWDVTLYRAELRDELINFSTNPGLGIQAATFNAPRTIHQGVEAAVSLDLVRDLTGTGDTLAVTQIWTHNDFRFVRDPVYGNNRIAGIPNDVLRTVLSYRHPSGFYFAPSVDWVPQGPFADHANTLQAPGYALFNIQTGIDFANGVSLFVDARNLTDERYISDIAVVNNAQTAVGGAAALAAFYPGNGRSVFAGVRASF
ncbi:TonB-dependent receptor family protein [Methylobacterium radiotolerans]|uniref:TonB-dependent receptor n=1 Tax=Methylobacterium radiotolerans (strain ATCC 27329 / DSM 1819 / JCM 2831 / NBRC 15690 / NCIMB 10815 / 0-1) TaxID=426355 RepID=B1M922_METRJ|nr:TonB-dependent receptor [Methylobacterium radiotolerans]ACB27997.1 TonB-dependent receptor [Methylobacterium radiotolerans JCM 2831]GEN01359.1 TonB-dependent receptor [Methylobacterium radiotolerans]